MSLLTGTSAERLRRHIKVDCHKTLTSSTCEVVETNETGKARVLCSLRDGDTATQWHIGHTMKFAALTSSRSADGTIVVRHAGGTTTAHIIECTATVGMTDLRDKLKPQFLGSLVRLLSICAVADIRLDDVVFYAAFRKSRFQENPTAVKLPITDGPTTLPEPLVLQREWLGHQPLQIAGLDPARVEFRQIHLVDDEAGTGAVILHPRAPPVPASPTPAHQGTPGRR
jgi:hypothetical protein